MACLLQFFRDRIWSAIPPDVTPGQRRTAGIAWPIALLLLAGFVYWKQHARPEGVGLAPFVIAGVALVLVPLLIASETTGRPVYLTVMRFFATIGFFVSHLLLILFFYLVVTPLALLLRAMGKDLIGKRSPPAWTAGNGIPERRRFYRLF